MDEGKEIEFECILMTCMMQECSEKQRTNVNIFIEIATNDDRSIRSR